MEMFIKAALWAAIYLLVAGGFAVLVGKWLKGCSNREP